MQKTTISNRVAEMICPCCGDVMRGGLFYNPMQHQYDHDGQLKRMWAECEGCCGMMEVYMHQSSILAWHVIDEGSTGDKVSAFNPDITNRYKMSWEYGPWDEIPF